MELPYGIAPPTWTNSGFHSLNTRPLLTVHRNDYEKFPRIFLSQTSASRLCSPVGALEDASFERFVKFPKRILRRKHVYTSDTARRGVAPSPGQSDVEEEPRKKRKMEQDIFEDPELQAILDLAEESLHQTRYLERETWRHPANVSASPTCIPNTLLSSCIDDALVYDAKQHLPSHNLRGGKKQSTRKFRTRNAISCVTIGNDHFVVYPSAGSLDSVALCSLSTICDAKGNSSHDIQHWASQRTIPDLMYINNDPICEITTADSDPGCNEPARFIAVSENDITLANIAFDGERGEISWRDQLAIGGVMSSAFNPHFPEEVALLNHDGLFAGSFDFLHDRFMQPNGIEDCFSDVQVMSEERRYRQLFYGCHPRSLFLSSRRELVRMDLRSNQKDLKSNLLLKVGKDWRLPKYDGEIAVCHSMARRGGFHFIIATKTCVNYVDIRMPHAPLLDWSLSLPLPTEQIAVTRAAAINGVSSDIIALSSRSQRYLEVFHAVHLDTKDHDVRPFHVKFSGKVEPPLPRAQVQWSDLPLAHLEQLTPTSDVSGIALVPHDNGKDISLVQWSPSDGLIAQLLHVKASTDNEDVAFESDAIGERPNFDSVVNIANSRQALMESGLIPMESDVKYPVSRSLPGSFLQRRTRRIFVEDAVDLRERLCRSDEDEAAEECDYRLPRPFIGDIEYLRCNHSNIVKADDASPAEETAVVDGKEPDILRTKSGVAINGDVKDFRETFGEPLPLTGLTGMMEEIGHGRTLDELARFVRSGMAHSPTPLGITDLMDAIETSPFVNCYEVEWHTRCEDLHDECPTHVASNEDMPPWVSTKVYFTAEVEQGEGIKSSEIPEGSQYGQLLSRMQDMFFED